jgi:hypothetical protein
LTLSTDVYRYVWDGRVQAAGINPYAYVPADERLTGLRDPDIYPNINRADYAPTIYAPAAQLLFLAVTRLSGTAANSISAMKVAMFGFDLVTIIAILALLRRDGLPSERVLIYAWHPLPIWEFSGTGHVDAAAVALMCIGILCAVSDRRLAAGAVLALSVLIKPFALVITPALWRRWDWRLPVAFAATVALCYLPYLGAGAKVLGFLGRYGSEEGYADGWGFFPLALLQAIGLPAPNGIIYGLIALAVLVALAAVVAFRLEPRSDADDAVLLATVFILLVSPHYAWYFAWVLPLLCRAPYVPLIYLTLASFAFYLDAIIGVGAYFKAGLVLYGGFAILAVVDLMSKLRLMPVRRPA